MTDSQATILSAACIGAVLLVALAAAVWQAKRKRPPCGCHDEEPDAVDVDQPAASDPG